MNMQLTREQRIEALKKELSNLQAELKKARGGFKRSILMDEIRSVIHRLEQLTR